MLQTATYSELREWGAQEKAIQFSKEARKLTEKSVFLSHSSKDNDLVAGVVLLLENHGGRVYVDDQDPSLPESDCKKIAAHLRGVIKQTQRFVLLASPRSCDSNWIPWELGLGDGVHGEHKVALFPSAETIFETSWSEREYLGLYRRIVYGDHTAYKEKIWMVIDHRNSEAVSLHKWLTS